MAEPFGFFWNCEIPNCNSRPLPALRNGEIKTEARRTAQVEEGVDGGMLRTPLRLSGRRASALCRTPAQSDGEDRGSSLGGTRRGDYFRKA